VQKRTVVKLRRSAQEAVAAGLSEKANTETDRRRRRKWAQSYRRSKGTVKHWGGYNVFDDIRAMMSVPKKGAQKV
jgi:hypothetical protein